MTRSLLNKESRQSKKIDVTLWNHKTSRLQLSYPLHLGLPRERISWPLSRDGRCRERTVRGDSTVMVNTVNFRVADTPVLRTEATPPTETTKKCTEATSAITEHFMQSQAKIFIFLLSFKRTIWTDVLNDIITLQSWNVYYFAHYFDQYFMITCRSKCALQIK